MIFSNAPDYEAPLDLGGNNKYNLTVSASNNCSSTVGRDIRLSKEIKLDSETINTSVEVQNIDEDKIPEIKNLNNPFEIKQGEEINFISSKYYRFFIKNYDNLISNKNEFNQTKNSFDLKNVFGSKSKVWNT